MRGRAVAAVLHCGPGFAEPSFRSLGSLFIGQAVAAGASVTRRLHYSVPAWNIFEGSLDPWSCAFAESAPLALVSGYVWGHLSGTIDAVLSEAYWNNKYWRIPMLLYEVRGAVCWTLEVPLLVERSLVLGL